jgi:hypothetical protein
LIGKKETAGANLAIAFVEYINAALKLDEKPLLLPARKLIKHNLPIPCRRDYGGTGRDKRQITGFFFKLGKIHIISSNNQK